MSFCANGNAPKVSLIKIDVQGAEIRVLRGARATIVRCHPALFVEVDDAALLAAGYSANQLFDEIEGICGLFVPQLTASFRVARRGC